MCLIVLAIGAHPGYPLLVVANRDEFHRRPTAPAAFWEDAPEVLGGRDLEAGGTWLGVTTAGRWAGLTNYREPGRQQPAAPSRGTLVASYLTGSNDPAEFAARLATGAERYNGFNLLIGAGAELWYCSNRGGAPKKLAPGVYGLSNHLLDTPWPKVTRSRDRLAAAIEAGRRLEPRDLAALADDRLPAADAELPSTGVPHEWERLLSAPCIVSPDYGTRSTTVLMIDTTGQVSFLEHTRDRSGEIVASRELGFALPRTALGI